MTREKFIKVLKNEKYSYEIEGDKIIVTHEDDVWLTLITSLPPGVEFNNRGDVWLMSLTSLPPGVVFNNGGSVRLGSLTSLPPDVEFNNGGDVDLKSLTSLPSGMEFNNSGDVYLESLTGDWFEYWKGNIDGIDSKRLLNLMISKGVFI